jgi:hypothetical protein
LASFINQSPNFQTFKEHKNRFQGINSARSSGDEQKQMELIRLRGMLCHPQHCDKWTDRQSKLWCTWRRVFSASWYWPDMTAHIHRVVYLEESVLGVLVLAGHDGHLCHPRLTHRQALDVLDVVHLVRFLIIYIHRFQWKLMEIYVFLAWQWIRVL